MSFMTCFSSLKKNRSPLLSSKGKNGSRREKTRRFAFARGFTHQRAREGNRFFGRRGQAAVFDGITLLLLASLSSALIFSFIGSYGVQESRVIRSAYILNYMQSAMKTFYHVDASTLSAVNNQERDSQGRPYSIPLYADLSLRPGGCDDLKAYRGSFTVADLLKRDLAERVELLDDRFDGASVAGITAVRCVFKEIVKPFAFSGYYYGFDVIGRDEQAIRYDKPEKTVTNFEAFTKPGGLSTTGICVGAQSPDVGSDVISVAAPAKVVYIDPDAPNGGTREIRSYTLRLCIWRPKA